LHKIADDLLQTGGFVDLVDGGLCDHGVRINKNSV
jgi:hypothetical protein